MPPPPVANVHATHVLDGAYGPPHPAGNAGARAGRSAKRAHAALMLEQTGQITTSELGEQEAFAVEESLAVVGAGAALPVGAPAWAVAMNDNINNQFANVHNQLANVQGKQTNAVAVEHADPIDPVTVAGNPPPAGFPLTYGQLLALTPAQSLVFLNYYGLAANPQATRNLRLRKFLGAR
eukprot:CAMPEP_0117020952 /NCGR_PEP_ID=MMETSP0472-20121206/15864_1 /TAXON_ID=693140 ORGANISM="Tiarina fusus, Strain LIS" /NCGR_SAMPLE_ID=MMETSP0472 /ASSEMBLY_ACC=CAM_ASM_000603 /LENGTH=179 /DNA_ID=CAMNT_0004726299 /DNA_START=192 /DNA_END=731 /DNA_ORIENTATION=+